MARIAHNLVVMASTTTITRHGLTAPRRARSGPDPRVARVASLAAIAAIIPDLVVEPAGLVGPLGSIAADLLVADLLVADLLVASFFAAGFFDRSIATLRRYPSCSIPIPIPILGALDLVVVCDDPLRAAGTPPRR